MNVTVYETTEIRSCLSYDHPYHAIRSQKAQDPPLLLLQRLD
jgi:hypothetical protein